MLRKRKKIRQKFKRMKIPKLQSIAVKDAPFMYVEAYKSLRTNLEFISAANDVNTFIITSALPDESKSNVAINLATSLSSIGKRVIVLECDLRKPAMHYYLKLGKVEKGLTSFLIGNADISECIQNIKNLNIHVIPAGIVPPNPSELLGQKRMSQLIKILKEKYDYVILDAPPVSVVTDAAVLGRLVDGVLLVIRSKYASTNVVRMAKKKLEDIDVKVFGAILTRYKPYRMKDPYYYY